MAGKASEIDLGVPTVQGRETTRYHLMGQDSKKVVGYVTQVIHRIQEEGEKCYRIHTSTEYIEGDSTEEISILALDEGPRPVSSHRVVKGKDGTILLESKQRFKAESVELPPNPTFPGIDGLSFCLRGCIFVPKKKIEVNAMCMEATVLRMHGSVSKDKVTVPAGVFECYKIEMVGELMETLGYKTPPGMGALMEHFMPSIRHWYSQEEPHYLVKYEGMALSSSATVHKLPNHGEHTLQELLSVETSLHMSELASY